MYEKKSALEILVLGTCKRQATQLRRALTEIGREYRCEKCNLVNWQGEPLVIEIHHLDGNPLNNISSNLQYLCPNCHSLTPNFYHTKKQTFCDCGKPKSKKSKLCASCGNKVPHLKARKCIRPDKELLSKLIWEKPTTEIATFYEVSDKAICKWCKLYGIEKPPRGYWTKFRKKPLDKPTNGRYNK